MVIFKGKRELKCLNTHGFAVCVQEKAWMDESLMINWLQIWYGPFTSWLRSLLVMDSFRGHLISKVKKETRKTAATSAIIPGVHPSSTAIGCIHQQAIQGYYTHRMEAFKTSRLWSHASATNSTEVKTISSEIIFLIFSPKMSMTSHLRASLLKKCKWP